jgi:methylated-DNA-[protein]-cysteine S-methyltransferase
MKYYTKFTSKFGEITLIGDENGINRLHWESEEVKRPLEILPDWKRNDEFFAEARKQLQEYFAGERKTFDMKLNPQGTDFQKRVWKALSEIPYGELRSYQDIAIAIGNKKACRAVGMANSRNPIPIIVPCHRVIGKNGKLVGFAIGLNSKQSLIQLEQ